MIRLLIDQDFDHDILRGLKRRIPDLDAITTHEVSLNEASDNDLLEWAAEAGRIIVTHDRKTMPAHAAARIAAGERTAGLVVVARQLPIGQAIDDLEIIATCSSAHEWENVTQYLPL